MKKRTYFLPIFVTLVIILGVVFLTVSLTRDPYAYAIKKGDSAMEEKDYHKAISEYTIAQALDSAQLEPYIKSLNAIVNSNDTSVVRDALQTINNCIEFCGVGSMSDKQIASAIDVLISKNNIQAAYDILNHLHFSYSESKLIKDKFLSISQILAQSDITENTDDDQAVTNSQTSDIEYESAIPTEDTSVSSGPETAESSVLPTANETPEADTSNNPEPPQKPTETITLEQSPSTSDDESQNSDEVSGDE